MEFGAGEGTLEFILAPKRAKQQAPEHTVLLGAKKVHLGIPKRVQHQAQEYTVHVITALSCITVLLHCRLTVLLYYCIAVLLNDHVTALLYQRTTVQLFTPGEP